MDHPWGAWVEDVDPGAALDVAASHATESCEPPPELLMPLLPYQKQFLAWALKQEGNHVRGGILADEMVSALPCAWGGVGCSRSGRGGRRGT